MINSKHNADNNKELLKTQSYKLAILRRELHITQEQFSILVSKIMGRTYITDNWEVGEPAPRDVLRRLEEIFNLGEGYFDVPSENPVQFGNKKPLGITEIIAHKELGPVSLVIYDNLPELHDSYDGDYVVTDDEKYLRQVKGEHTFPISSCGVLYNVYSK